MGCLPRSALFLVTESHSLTRIPEFMCPFGEMFGDPGLTLVVKSPSEPAGWVRDKDNPNHVYSKECFYGLKTKLHHGAWYDMLSSFLISQASPKAQSILHMFIAPQDGRECRLKGRKAVADGQIRKLNILLCPTAVLKSFRLDHSLSTMALDSIKFQCTVITKGLLPSAATMFNIPEYQLADIFTKALGRNRIEFLINKLGMRSFTPETLKQLADEVDE
ncbi:hypothetical protein Tco_1148257 [Tanacetum coccineum]